MASVHGVSSVLCMLYKASKQILQALSPSLAKNTHAPLERAMACSGWHLLDVRCCMHYKHADARPAVYRRCSRVLLLNDWPAWQEVCERLLSSPANMCRLPLREVLRAVSRAAPRYHVHAHISNSCIPNGWACSGGSTQRRLLLHPCFASSLRLAHVSMSCPSAALPACSDDLSGHVAAPTQCRQRHLLPIHPLSAYGV